MAAVDAALAPSSSDSSTIQPNAETSTVNDTKVSKLHRLLKLRLRLCATENRIKTAVEDLIRKYRTNEQLTDSAVSVHGVANAATKYSCYSTTCSTRDGPSEAGPCYSPLCRRIEEREFSCKLCLPEKLQQDMHRLSSTVPEDEDENVLSESCASHDAATENSPGFDNKSESNVCNGCVGKKQEVDEKQSVDGEVSEERTRLHGTTKELRSLMGLLQRHSRSGLIRFTEVLVNKLQALLDSFTDTRNPVCLRRTVRKSSQNKSQIPVAHDFRTRSCRQSVFVLPLSTLRHLARSGGMLFTIPGFSSTVSVKSDSGWIYVSPRPLFCTAWQYRTASAPNLSSIALQLRVLWCCIRWEDMSTDNCMEDLTVPTETDMVTTTTILRRRDVGQDGLHSEYLVRRVSVPAAAGDDWHGTLHISIIYIFIDQELVSYHYSSCSC